MGGDSMKIWKKRKLNSEKKNNSSNDSTSSDKERLTVKEWGEKLDEITSKGKYVFDVTIEKTRSQLQAMSSNGVKVKEGSSENVRESSEVLPTPADVKKKADEVPGQSKVPELIITEDDDEDEDEDEDDGRPAYVSTADMERWEKGNQVHNITWEEEIQFNSRLAQEFKIIRMDPNGDCFFAAISKAVWGTTSKQEDVRKKVHRELKKPSFPFHLKEDRDSLIQNVRRKGFYADEYCIKATTQAFKICIAVFTPRFELPIFHQSTEETTKTVCLKYLGQHYDLLEPINESSFNTKAAAEYRRTLEEEKSIKSPQLEKDRNRSLKNDASKANADPTVVSAPSVPVAEALAIQPLPSTPGMAAVSRKRKRHDSEDKIKENAKKVKTEAQAVSKKTSKRAACIFCNDGKMHPNIYKHLYECKNYDKSVEENRLQYSTCTELKIVNGASVMCGHKSYSRLDFIHHHWNEQDIYYSACQLCDDKLFRDIKKHQIKTHLNPLPCPFSCDYKYVTKAEMMRHIREKHSSLVYLKPSVRHMPADRPGIEDVSPVKIFNNLPTHYEHKNGTYFHSIYDSHNRRNILSSAVMWKREIDKRIRVRGRKPFLYDDKLHTVQPSTIIANQLRCNASHIEAASHHTYDKSAYDATFFNSNITFMSKESNNGLWKSVEGHEAKLIKSCDYILHVKGAIYDDEKNKPKVVRGGLKASIPTHHFAVLYMKKGKERKCQIFLIPNEISWDDQSTIFHHMCTLEDIENLSGLKFREEFKWEYLYRTTPFCQSISQIELDNKDPAPDRDEDDLSHPDYTAYQFQNIKWVQKSLLVLNKPCEMKNNDNSVCGKMFNGSRKTYIEHYQNVHGINKYVCEICPFSPIINNLLVHHSEAHCPLDPTKCTLCTNHAKYLNGMKEYYPHMMQTHGGQLGYIQYQGNRTKLQTVFELASINQFFQKPPLNLIEIDNNYYKSIWNTKFQRLEMTISVLQRNDATYVKERQRYQFKFNKSLALAQITNKAVNLTGHHAAHMEAAFLHKETQKSYFSTFTNTNLVPMAPRMNTSIWRAAENHKQRLLNFSDYILCISGAVYDNEKLPQIVPGGVAVHIPTHFYVIIFIYREDEEPRTQVFLLKHSDAETPMPFYHCRSTFQDIEDLTGLEFTKEIKEMRYSWDILENEIWPCKNASCTFFFNSELEKEIHELETFHTNFGKRVNIATANISLPIPCMQCPLIFTYQHKYEQHLNDHATKLQCTFCHRFFLDKRNLDKHLISKPLHRYLCLKNPEYFDTKKGMYFCTQCSPQQVFVDFNDLIVHMTEHSSKKDLNVCNLCKQTFSNKNHLSRHKNKSKVKCNLCKKDFCNKIIYEKHVTSDHKNVPKERCNVCLEYFFSWEEYLQHMKNHYILMKNRMNGIVHAADSSFLNKEGNKVDCRTCGLTFSIKNRLKNHQRLPVSCVVCKKQFCNRFLCDLHIRFEENLFKKCNECEWSYKRSEDLKSHYEKWHKL